jgi:flagellar hook-length control protein FliK
MGTFSTTFPETHRSGPQAYAENDSVLPSQSSDHPTPLRSDHLDPLQIRSQQRPAVEMPSMIDPEVKNTILQSSIALALRKEGEGEEIQKEGPSQQKQIRSAKIVSEHYGDIEKQIGTPIQQQNGDRPWGERIQLSNHASHTEVKENQVEGTQVKHNDLPSAVPRDPPPQNGELKNMEPARLAEAQSPKSHMSDPSSSEEVREQMSTHMPQTTVVSVDSNGIPAEEPANNGTNEIQASGVLQDIVESIQENVKLASSTWRLRLQPDHLGKIDVLLNIDQEGMQVTLHAENATAGVLLERHMPALRQALYEAGIQVSDLIVGYGGNQTSPHRSRQWHNANPSHASRISKFAENDPSMIQTVSSNRFASTSMVDYKI